MGKGKASLMLFILAREKGESRLKNIITCSSEGRRASSLTGQGFHLDLLNTTNSLGSRRRRTQYTPTEAGKDSSTASERSLSRQEPDCCLVWIHLLPWLSRTGFPLPNPDLPFQHALLQGRDQLCNWVSGLGQHVIPD